MCFLICCNKIYCVIIALFSKKMEVLMHFIINRVISIRRFWYKIIYQYSTVIAVTKYHGLFAIRLIHSEIFTVDSQ